MRSTLKAVKGQRMRFTAVVEKFGSKPDWHGYPQRTLLLKDVRFADTGEPATDHLWFVDGEWSRFLHEGTKFSFDASSPCLNRALIGQPLLVYAPAAMPHPAGVDRRRRPSRSRKCLQEPATGGPVSRDRTCGRAFRRTRRNLPDPALRSAAGRKDGLELPPDPRDTKAPLAADAACAFPSPCLQLNRKLSPRKVIKATLDRAARGR